MKNIKIHIIQEIKDKQSIIKEKKGITIGMEKAIRNIRIGMSAGIDDISLEMVKLCGDMRNRDIMENI